MLKEAFLLLLVPVFLPVTEGESKLDRPPKLGMTKEGGGAPRKPLKNSRTSSYVRVKILYKAVPICLFYVMPN